MEKGQESKLMKSNISYVWQSRLEGLNSPPLPPVLMVSNHSKSNSTSNSCTMNVAKFIKCPRPW